MVTRTISKPVALLLVFGAQAALFGLLGWLAYARTAGEMLAGEMLAEEMLADGAPSGDLAEKADLYAAPLADWTALATANMRIEELVAGWWADFLGLAAALALTTTALVVLVLRLYRQQAVVSESEQRFRALIEESVDGVIIHRKGVVLFANNAMAQMLGLASGAELIGQSLFRFLPRLADPQSQQPWWTLAEDGAPLKRSRWQGLTAKGQCIHVDILSQPVNWRGHAAIRSTVSDVTDQVILAERERRQTAILSAVNDAHSIYLNEIRAGRSFGELLAKILQISGCRQGVIAEKIKDGGGDAAVRILAASPAVRHGAGEETSALAARHRRSLGSFLGQSVKSGEVTIVNNVNRNESLSDATGEVANLLLLPLKLEKDVVGEIVLANRPGGFHQEVAEELSPVVRAITRIVADYRSTRLREAAEQASRMKSVFLAHMNHELRTPLSGVIANLELLRGTGLSDDQRELVEASMSAGKGLLGVIGDTLDLAKIEADKLTLVPAEFDVAAMLENVKSIYLAAAQDKQVELSTMICADVPRRVVADEMRLRQILSNLVSNAIKFTAKGRVCISLQAERADAQTARLHFAVDDTGIGFPPEAAGRLFKPFQQANHSISHDFGGTGLGLAIAHQLVALHGGEISCDAEPRRGCSFLVSIPVPVVDWPVVDWPVVDWQPAAETVLSGDSIVFLTPGSPPDGALLADLRAAGAEVTAVDTPDALPDALPDAWPDVEAGRRILVVDWDCEEDEARDLLERQGTRFDRILTVAGRDAARRRRLWLRAGNVLPLAAPLTLARVAAALAADPRDNARPSVAKEDPLDEVRRFAPGEAPSLLVVEDQPMNQKILERQLERLGVPCDLAANGLEALEMLARKHYEVIITDCAMPVMDGLELTRRIRAGEAAGTQRSTIIALTANAITGSAQACHEAGADLYLSKPLKLGELSAALTRGGAAVASGAPLPQDDPRGTSAREVAATTTPPIDRAGLAELIGQNDPAQIDQILREFSYNWQDSLSAIEHQLRARDAAGLREAAHAAKGTARYGMAARLADDCAQLEKLANDARWTASAAIVERLRRETRRLHLYLAQTGLNGHEQLRSA